MKKEPYLTYQLLHASYLRDQPVDEEAVQKTRAMRQAYRMPADMTLEDRILPGHPQGKKELKVRIYRPASETPLPMVLNFHGGGWMAGNLDGDDIRCVELAKRIPAIVISVEYTLCRPEGPHFPAPLMDCWQAYRWAAEHGSKVGGDPGLLGIHGSSAGGNLAAGLALYIRDKGGAPCSLAVLNCPCLYLDFNETIGFHQNYEVRLGKPVYHLGAERAYLGDLDGQAPSYYAFPGHCPDLRSLCPHMIIAAEYDSLRDDAIRYMTRLVATGIRTDFQLAARTYHCFTGMPNVYTDLTNDIIAFAFRREFGMLKESGGEDGEPVRES